MTDEITNLPQTTSRLPIAETAVSSVSRLWEEFHRMQALYTAQTGLAQRFLESQASLLADAILRNLTQIRFFLPDLVQSDPIEKRQLLHVPAEHRDQLAGGVRNLLVKKDLLAAFRSRLTELEESGNLAVATAAKLVNFSVVVHMVYTMLPAGKNVTYVAAGGEEIPTIPVGDTQKRKSALTARTDAIAEEGTEELNGEELLVPYVSAARLFFLPQWVAFDDQGHLLVNSLDKAYAYLASMQRYIKILHTAVALSPCIVADDIYQQKRYGMLGQLINQGRALAMCETYEIIATIMRRASANDLNRGLSLSLPYFDDQRLEMRRLEFMVVPAGRIMFLPAFVVHAARDELAKVAQDTRLNHSTRVHLVLQLRALEHALETSAKS
jgi:hypothetical protein